LAESLNGQGWRVTFAATGETVNTVAALAKPPVEVLEVPGQAWASADILFPFVGLKADLLVVDHYGLDAPYEEIWRPWVDRIMVIDDLANRPHDCDILLDQTFGRSPDAYSSLVPAHARLLLGSDYALLRTAFVEKRPAALAARDARRGRIEKVLVSFGTMDPDNVTALALEALRPFATGLDVDVVLGSRAPHLADVRARVEALPHARLRTEVTDMADLMCAADLAIGAGGTTSWERCCLGLPAIVVRIADNQKTIVANLAKAGAIVDAGDGRGLTVAKLGEHVARLLADAEAVRAMSQVARHICDGGGVKRTVAALEEA
jgi:UDP-2,4-diacetamido-2,4,6-trideoxy-beta-L-altropyranose hydrolase